MSYQNWVYTNPGWNNNTPPSLSSSNLNDIASALEKLNITDEQIAAIKQNLTDVTGYDNIQQGLGKLISVLATARNQDVEKIEQVEELAMKYYTKNISYTGNGNGSVDINYQSVTLQGALLTSEVKTNSNGEVFLIGIKGATNNSFITQGMYWDNREPYFANNAYMSINTNTHTLTISDSSGNSNKSGKKYNVLLFLS